MNQKKEYCEFCLRYLDDDKFDYRYDFLLCLDCGNGK